MDVSVYPFPQVTNRESWRQLVEIADADTGELIDLTGCTFLCDVRRQGPMFGSSGYGDSYGMVGSYDDYAALVSPTVSVVGTGQIQLDLSLTQMRSLPPGSYMIALSVTLDDDTRQLFVGELPVIYGGLR